MLKAICIATLCLIGMANTAVSEDTNETLTFTGTITTDAENKLQLIDFVSNIKIKSPKIYYKGKWHDFFPVLETESSSTARIPTST